MDASLTPLCRFFLSQRGEDGLALATIIATHGSTYRKVGTRILIARDGGSSGLLSGGCLEGELHEHAAAVISERRARRVSFDTRRDDPLWGMGLGCDGAIEVWIEPVQAGAGDGPLPYLQHCLEQHGAGQILTVVGGETRQAELGISVARNWPVVAVGSSGMMTRELELALRADLDTAGTLGWLDFQGRRLQVSRIAVPVPPWFLICGAGRDAVPVYDLAAELGWRVSVFDHRPAYANPAAFPCANVNLAASDELSTRLDLARIDAAVVMSHHLESDIRYLEQLLRSPVRHVGLLGPRARRDRILRELGRTPTQDAGRLHAPVGLDIGAMTPESIALAIVAQMHSALTGRSGGALPTR